MGVYYAILAYGNYFSWEVLISFFWSLFSYMWNGTFTLNISIQGWPFHCHLNCNKGFESILASMQMLSHGSAR